MSTGSVTSQRRNYQSGPRKRQRPNQCDRSRPSSSNSSQASIGRHYGIGDDGALYNIFASEPETFTTAPRPHGSRGLNESPWELRFDYEIRLSNDFPVRGRQAQCVRAPVPGPGIDQLSRSCPPRAAPEERSPTRPQFQSALSLVREVVGTDRRLTLELVRSYDRVCQWRKRWGYSPPGSDPFESPPPSSPRLDEPFPDIASHPSSDRSLSPVPTLIPNPPIPGEPAPSSEALFESTNSFAKVNGFGIVRRNAYSYKGRKIRYSFQCDRFGDPTPSRGAGLRQRRSRKCGCKWMVIAEALEKGAWLLRQHPNPEHSEHNHGRSIRPSAHPSHRRLTDSVRATVESTSRRVGIRARDVRAIVQHEHPESSLTRKDIYNARARINRDKLNGYSPTAALVKLFDEMELPYFVKWADDEPSRLVGLVWTFPYCLQMWKRFPEVVSFDNTYNTNRFKLPLFQATGQTCLGSVYNAAFGLIDNERREGFQFLSESMRQLSEQRSIRLPDVIITDFDNQMKAALDDQFPDAQQQLCIHHINSNVLLKSKQKWVEKDSGSGSSDEEDLVPVALPHLNLQDEELVHTPTTGTIPHSYRGVLMMWKLVVFAETEEAHEKAWKNLCTEFDDQRAILRYLHGTYMTTRAQWARCFIRKYRNFGVRVTSGTEASNNNIKSYLLNGMSNLYRLIEAMQDMMKDQERDFNDACAADEVLTLREYTGPSSEFLGELRTVLSSKGLALIMKQYRLAKKALPTRKNPFPDRLEDCSDGCSVSIELGIPCCHKIYSKLGSGLPFTRWDVHPRWHLRPSSSRDPYRQILDPKVASALRGRPKNAAQAVPARLAIDASTQASSMAAERLASQVQWRGRGRRPGRPNTRKPSKSAAGGTQNAGSHASISSQRQTRSQSAVLGTGKTTGVRASGQRTQPNIRRRRSQWEMLGSGEEVHPCIIVEQ
ncbi:hypothetical protein Purlil1_13843 [Purpureocillium lilacinum]|uniref:Mutator-like element n=1 Tax=Purpureocillium lilacinum TaxID=33203 RepID=A0ABR0BD25_PURLI|nr:hypothetical protein Purlil1_13843 [Purpureocillium lilacinum]